MPSFIPRSFAFQPNKKSTVRLVIKIDSASLDQPPILRTFAGELRRLLADRHRITVVHDCARPDAREWNSYTCVDGRCYNNRENSDYDCLACASELNKSLVGTFSNYGIAAFGLCGLDANLIHLRKAPIVNGTSGCCLEVCAVDSFWLDTISQSGGVPVLVNLARGPDQHCHLVNADQMAASCAVHWDADTLIFLSDCEGFVNGAGSISRWLNITDLETLTRHSPLNSSMLSKLKASQYALKHHVRRTRILPLSDLQSLSMFYSSKIDSGTELILDVEFLQQHWRTPST